MIFTDRTITVKNGNSSINEPIILYRGDKEVEIRFVLKEKAPFIFNKEVDSNIIELSEAAYGQLIIKRPNDLPAVFSEIAPTNEGKIVFTITAEMIDEITEVGNYTFQIRLLDESRNSRATLPEVVDGIEIREPIASEDVSTSNEVGVATVGYALTTTAAETSDVFDENGNYNKTTWFRGDLITSGKLNKIEAGIDAANRKAASGGTGGQGMTEEQAQQLNTAYTHSQSVHVQQSDIPTKTSDLNNDSNFVNETYVTNAINNAQLGGGGAGSNNAGDISIADTGNYFTATNVEGALQEAGLQIKEIANSGNISSIEPAANDIPKIFFYGNALPTTKDNVNLTMDYVSNTTKFSSFVKLKCQGTSSMSYAKKNFTVAMYSDEARATKLKKDFKGWGAQSKFCLKANYVDITHTRNLAGARIAYDMVNSRPDSPFKQQLLQCPRNGAVDGFPIKLYFNGEFYGIYTWNIPKDGWMFNMDENNPNHIVLCAEKNTDGNSSLINSCQFRQLWTNGDGNDWSVEFGTYSTDLQTKFNRVIAFVKDSTDEEFKANISQYLDLYSVIDYYCFSYLCCHLDGLAKNMLMVTYDGNIWGCSLYDMDSIFGVNWNGQSYVATNYQCPEQYQEQFSLLWPKIERCFGNELYQRYLELRRGALSLSNIIKHVEEIYDVIPDRVFADEKAKWTSLPNVNTNTMTRFRNYMRDRAVYVDAQMQEIGTKVPCTGIVLSTDTLSFTTADTQTLSVVVSPTNCTDIVTWSVSPTGIITVDNGVVTPVSNGTCTITATCGSYSDTCTVTVSLPIIECTGITLDQDTLTIDTSTSTTAQLTATVTPENCTQPVVWSVSPEGIVTVDNGLVTAVANGEATVTATCGSYSDTCAVTVSGIGVNKVENGWESATWTEQYYNDNGNLESFGTIHHSSLIPVNGNEIITVECDASVNSPYLRLSFFNSDSEYIGYDRGAGYNTPTLTNGNSITVNLIHTLANIAYVSINANTADKSLLTVSSTNSGYSIINVSTTYVNGNLNRDSNAVTSGTAGAVTENSVDITSDYIECINPIKISISNTTYFIGVIAYNENKEYLATCDGQSKTWHSEGYTDSNKYSNLLITTFPDTAKYIRFTVGGCTDSSLITVKTLQIN